MTEKHATLSASSSHRWLSAPPLPQLEKFFENKISEVAHEGTAAHALGEWKLRQELGENVKRPISKYQDKEMEQCADDYVAYVLETLAKVKEKIADPVVLIE